MSRKPDLDDFEFVEDEYYEEIHKSGECDKHKQENGNITFVCKCGVGTKYGLHSVNCKIEWIKGSYFCPPHTWAFTCKKAFHHRKRQTQSMQRTDYNVPDERDDRRKNKLVESFI